MRLVVFDMDGTLVDSAALMVESAIAAFEGVGLAAPDDATIRSVSGLTLDTGLGRLAPEADAPTIAGMAAFYRAAYLERATQSMREPLFPGALEELRRLHAMDDVFLAVATGKALRGASRVLATHGIADLFVSVHTPDAHASKPHPDMILAAMTATGVRPEATIMVGDTNHDMEMAIAAGVGALGVSWGYHEAEALRRAGAHRVIDSYADMPMALDELLERDNA